jgi:hypothetical protein
MGLASTPPITMKELRTEIGLMTDRFTELVAASAIPHSTKLSDYLGYIHIPVVQMSALNPLINPDGTADIEFNLDMSLSVYGTFDAVFTWVYANGFGDNGSGSINVPADTASPYTVKLTVDRPTNDDTLTITLGAGGTEADGYKRGAAYESSVLMEGDGGSEPTLG